MRRARSNAGTGSPPTSRRSIPNWKRPELSSSNFPESVSALAEYLRASRRMMIFTGAGISTGSGIPDFRGPQGVWKRRQPVYFQDFLTSEAARIEHWDYKLEGWDGFRNAQPNLVHHAIARLEKAGKVLMVVTQNIDGLHTLAGTMPAEGVELDSLKFLAANVNGITKS